MSTPPVTVDGQASLEETIGIMEQRKLKRLPVMSQGKLVGLISRADILRFLMDR
jgi:CBS domain-containing protein